MNRSIAGFLASALAAVLLAGCSFGDGTDDLSNGGAVESYAASSWFVDRAEQAIAAGDLNGANEYLRTFDSRKGVWYVEPAPTSAESFDDLMTMAIDLEAQQANAMQKQIEFLRRSDLGRAGLQEAKIEQLQVDSDELLASSDIEGLSDDEYTLKSLKREIREIHSAKDQQEKG